MPTTLNLTLNAAISWLFTNDLDLSDPEDASQLRSTINYTDGSGDNQVAQMWHDRRRVTPSTPVDDIDLVGVLENVFGHTVNFTAIKCIFMHNRGLEDSEGNFTPTAGEDLIIGGGTDPFSSIFNFKDAGRLTCKAGGRWFMDAPLDGWDVGGASSGDIFRVVNNGIDDITFDIVLVGVE